jgi:hypothetical protein
MAVCNMRVFFPMPRGVGLMLAGINPFRCLIWLGLVSCLRSVLLVC